MIIVNGETDEHLDMLEGGVIGQLLREKWKTFARVGWMSSPSSLRLSLTLFSLSLWFFLQKNKTNKIVLVTTT
jgi:hypothetical protein